MKYTAIVSSDWNECLAPCGSFDPISFVFPDLGPELEGIFRQYTSNEIPLTEATRRISALMPGPVTQEKMDEYLQSSFRTYRGVPELIEWCLSRGILFMINTTGLQGFFQRVFAKNLLPPVPIVAANPMIRFSGMEDDPRYWLVVQEIEDKPRNTELVSRSHGVPPKKVIVIGDSAGDGPHFRWAAENGAFLIASMAKPSLLSYCKRQGISVHKHFGVSYGPMQARNLQKKLQVNFLDLRDFIKALLGIPCLGRDRTYLE
ncbi:MAG: hypothetical protein FJY85_08635 [Deltaproteobacteria bacterium]|nr:hypothetical protein [Deltaproteobacteria bacterium]